MTAKPHQRRGLGRGLGSLIPTAPRPDHHGRGNGSGPDDDHTAPGPDAQPDQPVRTEDDQRWPRPGRHALADVVAPVDRDGDGDGEGEGDEHARSAGVAPESAAAGPGLLRPAVPGVADWIGVPLLTDVLGRAAAGSGSTPSGPWAIDRLRADHPTDVSPATSEGNSTAGAPAEVALAAGVTAQHGQEVSQESAQESAQESGHESARQAHDSDQQSNQHPDRLSGQHPDRHADRALTGSAEGSSADPTARSTESELRPVTGAWFAELSVADISPNPRQPREVFDEESMAELVQSILGVGLLQPVVVRPVDDDRYELVMGERRWRATQLAGLGTIPAIVRETADDALLRDALLENLHRSQLNALEEAAAYQQLLEDFGCTHEELASRLGRSRPQISNTIRLLRLSPAVQRRVAAGILSAGHARALLAVENPDVQDRLAGRVVAEGISVRGLEEIVAVGDTGSGSVKGPQRSRPTAPGVDDLAARLSDRLDTRVRVDLGKRKGRITVEFASLPDLERIIALIDPEHPTRTRRDQAAE